MPAKVVPSLLMKGQLTDCPRKTGWVCTQEPNPLPNLIFQPQSVLPWTIYTTQGFFSMSPLHHSYCHCTCSGDSIVVALSSSSSYIAVVNINYLSLVALLFHVLLLVFFLLIFVCIVVCVSVSVICLFGLLFIYLSVYFLPGPQVCPIANRKKKKERKKLWEEKKEKEKKGPNSHPIPP